MKWCDLDPIIASKRQVKHCVHSNNLIQWYCLWKSTNYYEMV